MSRPERNAAPTAVPATEVYLDAAVGEALGREAARLGVTVSEYVHDAALARAVFALGARGEGSSNLLAAWARTLLDAEVDDGDRRADKPRLIAALTRDDRQEVRDGAAAVRAERRQACRRAAEVRGDGCVILDTVARMVTDVLRRHGFALHAPVVARFRTAESGSTGAEVAVRLKDPSQASAARAAIVERFPDHLSEVIVS